MEVKLNIFRVFDLAALLLDSVRFVWFAAELPHDLRQISFSSFSFDFCVSKRRVYCTFVRISPSVWTCGNINESTGVWMTDMAGEKDWEDVVQLLPEITHLPYLANSVCSSPDDEHCFLRVIFMLLSCTIILSVHNHLSDTQNPELKRERRLQSICCRQTRGSSCESFCFLFFAAFLCRVFQLCRQLCVSLFPHEIRV